MLDLFLLYLLDPKNVIQLIDQYFFKRFIFGFSIDALKKRKFFQIIYIIIFKWYCHIYALQMINLDIMVNNNNEKHNEKWPYIPDHSYRILITGGSG